MKADYVFWWLTEPGKRNRNNCTVAFSTGNITDQFNKLTSVFHASVQLHIDHKFRHHIVKEAVEPRGDS